MKKGLIALSALIIFSLTASAQKGTETFLNARALGEKMAKGDKLTDEEKKSLPTKEEDVEYAKSVFPNLLIDENEIKIQEEKMNGSSCTSSNNERKVLWSIGWASPSTGCIGYDNYCVHSFLGVTWGEPYYCGTVVVACN